jgi:cytidylate kinase (EC 2.7.4.14)
MDSKFSIAIDGPAAAGKSTVAKLVAKQLNYLYIDTGAMYRALTWKALQTGTDPEDEEALYRLLLQTDIRLEKMRDGLQQVYVDGKKVTEDIRLPDVTKHVSAVSRHETVRREMVRRQRKMASSGGVIMDGRDIGTVVLPDAEVKIFLKASVEERARRRHEENLRRGIPSSLEQIKEEIKRRDKIDTEREIAPLKKADDAVEIDTTSLTIEEVAERILQIVRGRLSG